MKVLGIRTTSGDTYYYQTEDHASDPDIIFTSHDIVIKNVGNYDVIAHPMCTVVRWWVTDEKNVNWSNARPYPKC